MMRCGACLLLVLLASNTLAAEGKPNILVIRGDDIGQSNISAYTHGLMGYKTPNIDRISDEGEFLATFKEYPPRQKAASFSLDQVMDKLSPPGG